MKAKVKKARMIKRTLKRALFLFSAAAAVYFLAVSALPRLPYITGYLERFGTASIDTGEIGRYYDLLVKNAPRGKGLVLELGVPEKDGLQAAVDRIKDAMGLPGNRIWLAHHDAEKPPAYIQQLGYGDMGILISRNITSRREELNLLAHELCHVYVWKLDQQVFGKCDQEKLVDCSGVFLGLGVLILNGFTDETAFLPGGGYEERKKAFGYLKPEQFGYLLARYCSERGIPPEAVNPFLNTAGRRYFGYGYRYIKKKGPAPAVVRNAGGLYWCAKCGSMSRADLSKEAAPLKCPVCG